MNRLKARAEQIPIEIEQETALIRGGLKIRQRGYFSWQSCF
ncbi:hypothetical protein [Leptolyngbya sp. NIES-2104]|nr:hypothetical protein [Leptolyngbya sp. NIES-2104]GAP96707.1 hypothetical protein NIES2104_32530 [Leptolyngbya sp. NIES-2104]